ncbi:MAG: NAD(P)-dependent oxidoreductase [Planctomycetes bacterium]|nr:NAD(P)-dependent oxidoreductase [Planctomycetota bacterium]
MVTGAAGRIGAFFARQAHERYDLRLLVQAGQDAGELAGCGEVVAGDLADLGGMKLACAGIDTVLHLAASPDPSAPWAVLLADNIVGCYHAFVAARTAGCRRVVFASSIHAVSGYPPDVQVKTGEPVNPGDLYGVSKCFGEALGRYMAEQEGLSVIAVRIGAFQPRAAARAGQGVPLLDAFISRRDLVQLLCRAIDVPDLRFAIVHGLSDNRFKRLDLSDARALLGYQPQDDATELDPALRALHLRDTVRSHDQRGGGQRSGIRDELDEPEREA